MLELGAAVFELHVDILAVDIAHGHLIDTHRL